MLNVLKRFFLLQPAQQQGHSQFPSPPGVGDVNQPGMQPSTYQPGPGTQSMTPNHIPNSTPNQNANLSSSFGRMSLQVPTLEILQYFL